VVPDAPHGGEHDGQGIVRLGRDEPDRACVHLFDHDRLAGHHHHGQRGGHQVLVQVEVLVPEDEVVGGEGVPVAPPHASTEEQGGDLAVRADLPAASDVGDELGAGVVIVEELVVLGDAMTVGGIEGSGEAPTPGAAV